MSGNMSLGLLLAAALAWPLAGSAETVYRCGDSYGQQPCPGGKPVQADDPRSESQRAQTREAVRRDAKVADEMQKARLKEEAKPAQAIMPPPKAETPEPPTGPAVTGVAKKPAYFTAVAPKKKDKAQPGQKKKKSKKKTSAQVQAS